MSYTSECEWTEYARQRAGWEGQMRGISVHSDDFLPRRWVRDSFPRDCSALFSIMRCPQMGRNPQGRRGFLRPRSSEFAQIWKSSPDLDERAEGAKGGVCSSPATPAMLRICIVFEAICSRYSRCTTGGRDMATQSGNVADMNTLLLTAGKDAFEGCAQTSPSKRRS